MPITHVPTGGVSSETGRSAIPSTDNSSTSALSNGAVFTGEWEDVGAYSSVVVAVKTDQDGLYAVQFSPDGVNQDSTLTRYYRTSQIEPPHRFTITRRYCRVVFTNASASPQTYFRLQTLFGDKPDLNAPLDSTVSQDFDSTLVRPTDYKHEVSLGLRQGSTLWNKFGYNEDVGTSAEVLASWGGTFTPMTTARTLSVVSTAASDTDGGAGANNVVIYGIDANRLAQTVVVAMGGLTPGVTTETWLGVNRVSVGLAGSSLGNDGTITITATTDLTTQAQVPAGEGTSQQCIFHIQAGHTALTEWLTANVIRFGSGAEPVVTVRGWVYSAVSNAKYEVFRQVLDASIVGTFDVGPPVPFPIGGASVFWLEVVSSRAATAVNGRFSLIEVRSAST